MCFNSVELLSGETLHTIDWFGSGARSRKASSQERTRFPPGKFSHQCKERVAWVRFLGVDKFFFGEHVLQIWSTRKHANNGVKIFIMSAINGRLTSSFSRREGKHFFGGRWRPKVQTRNSSTSGGDSWKRCLWSFWDGLVGCFRAPLVVVYHGREILEIEASTSVRVPIRRGHMASWPSVGNNHIN